jgi:hypothetical protein
MFKKFIPCFILLTGIVATGMGQQKSGLTVTVQNTGNSFQLFKGDATASFTIDVKDAKVVVLAADAFLNDVKLISGNTMQLNDAANGMQVVAGTIGQSNYIDELIKEKRIDVSTIQNKWECFSIQIIRGNTNAKSTKLPFRGAGLLVIAGSDPRGTAFGIFHLSKLMGISPFVWWADVRPQPRKQLFVSGSYISKEPSVKYRGIFLNDEDWGLQPWAAKTFEPETGDIGPKTYSKIFELLLRLKANIIWPAMHPSTKAFFYYPGNVKTAGDYQIVVGSSHAEPMLRNNVGEWDEKTMGHFNYLTNKETVYKYWEERVKESSGIIANYSLGMRGVHDSGLEGIKDPKEAVPLMERIFEDQRAMLEKYINKDITAIPQVLTVYKEVLDIYDQGLKVPEDVTLVWPDDNYGYIQRLNNEKEKKRSGGSGVYYHASYWGRPHDYLWLSSTHPSLIREEMMKAYENGSNN